MRTTLRCILCIAMIVTTITSLTAQQSKIDSLTTLLESHVESDTSRVRIMNQLAYATLRVDPSTAKPIGQEALALAEEIDDVGGQANCHYTLTITYLYLGEMENSRNSAELCRTLSAQAGDREQEADGNYLLGYLSVSKGDKEKGKAYYQTCIDISEDLEYRTGIGQGSKGLGDLFETEGDYAQARLNYELSLRIGLEENNKNNITGSYNDLGRIAEALGDYDKALEYYLLALPIAEKFVKNGYTGILNNIGSLYTTTKNYPKALEYINQALEVRKETNDKRGIAFSMQDLADVYEEQGKFDEALKLYHEVLEMRTELEDKRGLSFTHIHMSGIYNSKGNHDKALVHAKKSLALREEIGFKSGISRASQAVGSGYMHLKRYDLAIPLLKKSLRIALDIQSADEIVASNSQLSKCYEKMGNFKLALRYHKSLKTTKDSLFTADQNKQFANMQTRYETEKKEKQIAQQENSIMELETNNAQIARQRNYIFGGGSLIGLLAFLGYRVNKIRKDRNDKIEFAEALLYTQEEERKRIARDLHDSIGQSLLLVKKELMGNNAVTHQNQALISNTLEEVRAISRDLHPFQLDKFGFTATIKDVLEKVQKSSGLFISHDITDIDDALSDKEEIHLYRVIQETFNNIIKHAKATAANLVIAKKDDGLEVVVRDNGVGYDHEYALVKSKSLGLRTMHERISAIGGKLNVRGGDPQGTIIEIKIPNKV